MADCAGCPGQAGCRDEAPAPRALPWRALRRQVPLSGILNVDKPPGMTSHDVVDAIRRVAGQRKVGHAGTLDPMATGVLLVCLGQATRVTEYLMAGRKHYRATVLLGTETDTYDLDGHVVAGGGRTEFSADEIEAALSAFRGAILQVPPIYSALKRDGQPLYKLARQGVIVERAARPVEIYELAVLDWTPPSLILDVACSPGTYIRSLAHDLGRRLGCGGTLACLVRTASGHFSLETAASLARLEEAFEHGQEGDYLLAPDEALVDWPALIVGDDDGRRIATGQGIAGAPPPAGASVPGEDNKLARAYNLDGDFLAILRYDGAAGLWRPKKVFAPGPEHDSA